MKTFVVTVPKLLNNLDDTLVEVDAENEEVAVERIFEILPPGRGLNLASIKVEERKFGLVESLWDNRCFMFKTLKENHFLP